MRKNIYKLFSLGTIIFISVGTLTGCKQDLGTSEDSPQKVEVELDIKDSYSFVFSGIDMDNPYFDTLDSVIREALTDDGHTLLTVDPKNDVELQNRQIIELLEKNEFIDAVFIAPVDWEGVQPALDMIEEKGIKVINVDSQIKTTTIVDAYIGSDNTKAGNMMGTELIERYPEGAKVMVVENHTRNSTIERINGFESSTAGKGFETVARITTTGEKEESKDAVKEFLQEGTDVEVIVCGNDQMALGALEAVKSLDIEVMIISVDGSPEVKELIKEGEPLIIGTIAQSPINIGKLAAEIALNVLKNESFTKSNKLETYLINDQNIAIYGAEGWQ